MRTIRFRQYYEGNDDSYPEWNYFDLRRGGMVVDGGWKDPQQFTGLVDRHRVDIYEGDILSQYGQEAQVKPVVEYHEASFKVIAFTRRQILTKDQALTYEVIGNVWENPELLEDNDE